MPKIFGPSKVKVCFLFFLPPLPSSSSSFLNSSLLYASSPDCSSIFFLSQDLVIVLGATCAFSLTDLIVGVYTILWAGGISSIIPTTKYVDLVSIKQQFMCVLLLILNLVANDFSLDKNNFAKFSDILCLEFATFMNMVSSRQCGLVYLTAFPCWVYSWSGNSIYPYIRSLNM